MKLISEIVEQVQVITEEKSKDLYLEGVFLQSELANRNNRIYPKAVMEKEVTIWCSLIILCWQQEAVRY